MTKAHKKKKEKKGTGLLDAPYTKFKSIYRLGYIELKKYVSGKIKRSVIFY